jgi:hypothetical protein
VLLVEPIIKEGEAINSLNEARNDQSLDQPLKAAGVDQSLETDVDLICAPDEARFMVVAD